jgi:hypothetical protein
MELAELQCNSGLKEICAAELSIFYIYIHVHAHRLLKMIQLLAKYMPCHKFNPSSVPQGHEEIPAMGHMGGGRSFLIY